jgi:hypothetical protein
VPSTVNSVTGVSVAYAAGLEVISTLQAQEWTVLWWIDRCFFFLDSQDSDSLAQSEQVLRQKYSQFNRYYLIVVP